MKATTLATVFAIAAVAIAWPVSSSAQRALKMEQVPKPALTPGDPLFPNGSVIIDGLGASSFQPALWQADTLHWMADIQYPLFSAKPGKARNIYAASSVEEPWGWRVYYSAWDGGDKQNDCLYEGKTTDFLTVTDRQMVVSHGEMKHVSNASAQKLADGTYELMGTSEGLKDATGKLQDSSEKPAVFESKDGEHFNGDKIPYEAKPSDNLKIANYPNYDKDHFNGANVLFRDTDRTRFVFKEWSNDRANAYWAEGSDPFHLKVGGVALKTILAPNDLRKFTVRGKNYFLLALYKKADVGGQALGGGRDTDHVWYSLSNNAHTFTPEQHMFDSVGRPDLFIFSVNWVSRGDKLLGFLYGGNESASVDHNQIFATWLQKRALLVALPGYHVGNGGVYPADGALGPDRQRFTLPGGKSFDGTIEVFDDDGKTPVGTLAVHLEPGQEYKLSY